MRFLESILGEHVMAIAMQAIALISYLAGTTLGAFWIFAQTTTTELPGAIGTFLATSGPAGALVAFLIWWIGRCDKKDSDKDDKHTKAIESITETFVNEVRDIRKESNAREDVVVSALRDNTRILAVVQATCPAIGPHVDPPKRNSSNAG